MYTLRFDGLYKKVSGERNAANHAGFMCYGWLIFKNGTLVARGHGAYARGRDASSNVAEYLALIAGLEALNDLGIHKTEPVAIIGDAKSVIDQMTGDAGVNSPSTLPHYRQAKRLVHGYSQLTWCWTPREFNRAADRLTRRAMNQVRWDQDEYQAAVEAIRPVKTRKSASKEMLPLVDFRVYQINGSQTKEYAQ